MHQYWCCQTAPAPSAPAPSAPALLCFLPRHAGGCASADCRVADPPCKICLPAASVAADRIALRPVFYSRRPENRSRPGPTLPYCHITARFVVHLPAKHCDCSCHRALYFVSNRIPCASHEQLRTAARATLAGLAAFSCQRPFARSGDVRTCGDAGLVGACRA